MRALKVTTAVMMLLSWPAQSEPVTCEGSNLSANAATAWDARLVCEAAAGAVALFASCGVPEITRPLRIDLIDDLKAHCFGRYHCGEDWIEIVTPSGIAEQRLPDSIYSFLPIDTYFQSIVVHELTHAAIEDAPCPFDSCLVANEYLAYVMQILSLSPSQQGRFGEQDDPGRRISRDELNPAIYFMAPDVFARKVWLHFTQRDDPCGFVGQIVDGTVLLDYERF